MTVFGICEKGPYRKENQDRILMRSKGQSGLFLVADGVGGSLDGQGASSYIAQRYGTWWEEVFLKGRRGEFFPLFSGIKELAEEINGDLCRLRGPGNSCSTLALLFIHRGIFGYVSSGDSRIYRCGGAEGVQAITRDDVWENSPEHGSSWENAGKIMSALGGSESLDYSSATDQVRRGEVFMLCSDGVYKFLEKSALDGGLERMRRSFFLKKNSVDALAKKVTDNDTKDNYSLIVLKV